MAQTRIIFHYRPGNGEKSKDERAASNKSSWRAKNFFIQLPTSSRFFRVAILDHKADSTWRFVAVKVETYRSTVCYHFPANTCFDFLILRAVPVVKTYKFICDAILFKPAGRNYNDSKELEYGNWDAADYPVKFKKTSCTIDFPSTYTYRYTV